MSKKRNNNQREHVVPEDEVQVDSFKAYPASDDDKTRVGHGTKEIESFHLYGSENDHNNDED